MEIRGETKAQERIVLVVYPFQGHINPMLDLATILHSKGFSITIVHPQFNSPNPSNHPEFTFIPIPDNLSKTSTAPENCIGMTEALNKNCQEPFLLYMKKILQDEDGLGSRIRCIIYDGLLYFAQSVADDLNVPGISVRTSAATTILGIAVLPSQNEQGHKFFLDSSFQDKSPDLQFLKLKNLLASLSTQNLPEALLKLRKDVANSMMKSSAIIANTMHFLEHEALTKIQECFRTPIFTIGPFHKLAPTASSSLPKEDTNCISWLDKQAPRSVIYVSFGSMATMSEKDLIEMAWGLANSMQPFLWVVRPGLIRDRPSLHDLLPKKFVEVLGERGCIVKWAPQKDVLAHGSVGGFWSHCGWNSTLESVCEGVPMLCRPFFGDQKLNVRYVCDVWKVGIELTDELERGKIESGVRRLMVDEVGEEVRQNAMEYKEKNKACLEEGGSTYNSLNDLAKHMLSF